MDGSPGAAVAERLEVAPGSVVFVRDEEWLVTGVDSTVDGWLLTVEGLSELVRGTTATFYESLDTITVVDPAKTHVVADSTPRYRRTRLWLEAMVRRTALPIDDPSLAVSSKVLADPLEYQHDAVRRALRPENLRPRILLADAVGLGKSLEIGMILSELVRRGRGERILIVSPRHVLEQMQHEMWTRFALPFVRLDSLGIQRVRQKLPATRNPFTMYKRAIISIDTLKSDRYLAHLRHHRWDAVVIDESHSVTNSATQNNRLARVLAPNTDALILASATPHNGRKESFAELIRLLEPTAVTANDDLVAHEAHRLVVRRHRYSPEVARVVGGDWAERAAPVNRLVPASPEEDAVADELAEVWLHPKGSSPYSGRTSALFPWTLAKAFLSSPAALNETCRERIARLDSEDAEAAREVEALERLAALTDRAATSVNRGGKYGALLAHLGDIGVGRGKSTRVVVFAERLATLGWLAESLRRDLRFADDAVRVMHGGLSDQEQQEIVESFKQEGSPIRVLVTGDVASEGVNLHLQCHHLVHFDIPWSLIRIEQRNGRIDRYGQKHPPQITTLLLEPSNNRFSGDLRVLTRLLEREDEAHRALGDVGGIMGEYRVEAEEDAIRDVLAGKTTSRTRCLTSRRRRSTTSWHCSASAEMAVMGRARPRRRPRSHHGARARRSSRPAALRERRRLPRGGRPAGLRRTGELTGRRRHRLAAPGRREPGRHRTPQRPPLAPRGAPAELPRRPQGRGAPRARDQQAAREGPPGAGAAGRRRIVMAGGPLPRAPAPGPGMGR